MLTGYKKIIPLSRKNCVDSTLNKYDQRKDIRLKAWRNGHEQNIVIPISCVIIINLHSLLCFFFT